MTKASKPRTARRAARRPASKASAKGATSTTPAVAAAPTDDVAGGAVAPPSPVVRAPIETKPITSDERAVLQRLDEAQVQLQRQMGALRGQIKKLEQQEMLVWQQLTQKEGELQQESVRVAKAHGVDVDDHTKRWFVNVREGQIQRVQ